MCIVFMCMISWMILPPYEITEQLAVGTQNCFLWAPAQRKRATMLYFANVFIYLFIFFMAALFSGHAWLTEVRENFTRGRP